MHPVLLEFGSFRIYSYGFMLALSFFAGMQLSGRRAGKFGVKRELIYDLSIILIIAAVVGSRMLYIVAHRDHYSSLLDIISLWQGGATYYGGMFLAVAGAAVFLRIKSVPFFRVADITAPPIALGVFITRIGCFLSGCCFGSPTTCPLGIVFPEQSHAGHTFPATHIHPTQLYSSASGAVMCLILYLFWRRSRKAENSKNLPPPFAKPGSTFALMFVLYGIFRFLVEFLRDDNPFEYSWWAIYKGGTVSQNLGIYMVIFGTVLMLIFQRITTQQPK